MHDAERIKYGIRVTRQGISRAKRGFTDWFQRVIDSSIPDFQREQGSEAVGITDNGHVVHDATSVEVKESKVPEPDRTNVTDRMIES